MSSGARRDVAPGGLVRSIGVQQNDGNAGNGHADGTGTPREPRAAQAEMMTSRGFGDFDRNTDRKAHFGKGIT